MATQTTNYGLTMPSYNEVADIEVINDNMNLIDAQMKKNADGVSKAKGIVSDEYSVSSIYNIGDYCIYENKLYRCITAVTTGEAFDSAKWKETSVKSELSTLNSNLKLTKLIQKSYYDGGTTGFIVGDGVIKLCDGTSSNNTSGVIFLLPFGCKSVKFHVEMQSGGYIQYGDCTFDAYMPNVITEGRGRGNYWVGSNEGGDKSIDVHGVCGCFFIGGYKATITNIRAELY